MAPLESARHIPFKARLDIALRLMDSRGMWRSNYAPDVYRFLWFLGVPIRPPHFARPIACATFHTLCMYVISWALLALVQWLDYAIPVAIITTIITIGVPSAGPIYGILMAIYYRYNARRHGLPHWSALDREAEIFD